MRTKLKNKEPHDIAGGGGEVQFLKSLNGNRFLLAGPELQRLLKAKVEGSKVGLDHFDNTVGCRLTFIYVRHQVSGPTRAHIYNVIYYVFICHIMTSAEFRLFLNPPSPVVSKPITPPPSLTAYIIFERPPSMSPYDIFTTTVDCRKKV